MKELICTVCPRGCKLIIDDKHNVSGNLCARGIPFAISETTNPKRSLTTTVAVLNASVKRLPVRTSDAVPKSKMFDVLKAIQDNEVLAPIKCGDTIIKNILDLNVDIIAMRTIEKN